MSKATVLTLVTNLTLGAASDTTITGNYYDRVVEDLARFPWLTNMSLIPVTAPTAQYVLDTTQVKIAAMFYDSRQLSKLTLAQVEALNRTWRNEVGEPHSYVVEDEGQKTFRLYPSPNLDSKPQSFPNTQPFGLDFPAYTIVILHTETRTDLPAWLELPVALETAARAMEAESTYRDVGWAQQAHQMAAMLFNMVGVD